MSFINLIGTFLITSLSLFALKPMASRVGLIDIPGGRKQHKAPTPLVGGLAIYVGTVMMSMLTPTVFFHYSAMLAISALVLVIGIYDDARELKVSIRMGVLNLMASLRDEQNIAFLYVTHDIASARYFADETLVMYAGHMVEGAPSEELVTQPQHPYTQLLLSACPDPAKGLRTDTTFEARGEVPNLSELGVGCPFAPRCRHAMTKCSQAMPPITHLSDTRWTRCFLFNGH